MLLQCYFESWALHHAVNAMVILPTDCGGKATHRVEKKLPVVYLLHGGGGDYSHWLRMTSVERYANERGVAVVLPSCVDMCYRTAGVTFPGMAWEADKVEDYETFISRELPDWAAANFPISTAPEDSAIAGLSLGGYGAAYHGFTHPERYAAVGLFSPYLFHPRMFDPALRQSMSREELEAQLIPDLVEPVKKIAAEGGRFPRVMLLNGSRDVRELTPVYADLLRRCGAEVTTDFDSCDLGHEWAFWDLCAKRFLDWL